MLRTAIPVLHVRSSRQAEEFYVGKLGFKLGFAMRLSDHDDPCTMGLQREGAHFHVSSFPGDGVSGGVVMIQVDDVDALYRELAAKGVGFDPTPVDQSWGNREMYTRDPDGNTLRFFQPMPE